MFHKDETDNCHFENNTLFKNTTIQVFPENQLVGNFKAHARIAKGF